MWNQDLYHRAFLFAGEAHGTQKIPGSDVSYTVHLANVCMEVMTAVVATTDREYDANLAMLCALLHDTIEDTEVTYGDVEEAFGKQVADGVLALTKDESLASKGEMMVDSLRRIKEQPAEVWLVKLADRTTNMNKPPHYWRREKRVAYRDEALLILRELGAANAYLAERLGAKIEDYGAFL